MKDNPNSIYLEDLMQEYLESIMKRDQRSFNQVVNIILNEWKTAHPLDPEFSDSN